MSAFGLVHGRVLQPAERVRLAWNAVSEDYFKTLEIPVLTGRSFSVDDGWRSPRVAIVNETLARQLFPGQNPIGSTIGRNEKEQHVIVGVARDTKYADLLSNVRAAVYFPIYQFVPSDVTVGLTPSDPMTLTAAVAVLTAVSVVAAYIPARWASQVEPMVALRVE